MKKQMVFLILALLLSLISIPIIRGSYEGFSVLTPGAYPTDVNMPLLHDMYPLKKKMEMSENTYEENYPNYPIFGSSYGQYTNNIRYWSTPNNGLCSPAEFCNGIYDKKKLDVPQTPSGIPFSSPDIRVNYYTSHKLTSPTEVV